MAPPHSQTTIILLIILFTFSSFKYSESFEASESCGIAVYWGQNQNEGSLRDACAPSLYKYVILAFLKTFGSNQAPVLNLSGHCNPSLGTCASLGEEIRYCQNMGIKVLLSIGGPSGSYKLSSRENARGFANYLWETFLSGTSNGPLGNIALDGISFDIERPRSTLYWDDLARSLAGYSTPQQRIYLAAAPQCPYPDTNLDAAIKTGLFDYVWVHFYNNPSCDYSRGPSNLIDAWRKWSNSLPLNSQLFLGLPASPEAASKGFIPSGNLHDILQQIGYSRNYGGVMLWSRLYDSLSGYGAEISSAVCSDTNLKLPSDGLYSNY